LYAFLGFTNEPAQVVPTLEHHLQSATTARAAADVLIHFGPAANWPIARALTHPEARVRTAAALALMRIQGRRPQPRPASAERLRVRSNLQTMAMLNAGTYDRSRFTVARALVRNLDHPDVELRHYFADLLVEFSDGAVVALPEVIQALSSDDMYVAFRAWMVFDLMPLDEIEFVSPGR
jgi:HEAT repeat protein